VLAAVPELSPMTMMPATMTSIPPSCHTFSFSRMMNQAPMATSIELAELMATMGPRELLSCDSPSLRVSMAADSVMPATMATHTNLRAGRPLKPRPLTLNPVVAHTPMNPMVIHRTNGAVMGVLGFLWLHSTSAPSSELVMP
jgi:hypothetical protein